MRIVVACVLFCMSFGTFGTANDPASVVDPKAELTKRVFNELRFDNTEILNDFYHPDIEFHDPVGSINGLDSMKNYYKKMYQGVESIRFEFNSFSSNVQGRYFFSWDMYLKTPKLNSGEEFKVVGVSEILFSDNLVVYHRDYFDMGEFIYEKLPVFGRLVKLIRKRLKN